MSEGIENYDPGSRKLLGNNHEALAEYLDISVKDVILLSADDNYQRALQRQIARTVYDPMTQAYGLNKIVEIATGRNIEAKPSDMIAADKHLRSITAPPEDTGSNTAIGINISFEGVSLTEARKATLEADIIDAEFKEIDDPKAQEVNGKKVKAGKKQLANGNGSAASQDKVMHRFAREGDSPTNFVTELYQTAANDKPSLFEDDEDRARESYADFSSERPDIEEIYAARSPKQGAESADAGKKVVASHFNDRQQRLMAKTRGWND